MKTFVIKSRFTKICEKNPNLVEIGQKYRHFETKTYLHCIVDGDIKSPQKRSPRVIRYSTRL
jgi:hypothetical protein